MILSALALLPLLTPALPQGSLPTDRKIESLLDRGKWAQAEEALETVLAAKPESGLNWLQLAHVRHVQGDLAGAVEAGEKAAQFPEVRPTALYNLACAHSLLGKVDAAFQLLSEAQEAGFLDFDLMATDSDLEALRAKHALTLPPELTYRDFKGRNRVEVRHFILEPREFDAEKTYPVLIAFAPGAGSRGTDWMLSSVFAEAAEQGEWIVVGLVPPERGWHTHPTHHALEDLLKKLKKDYRVEGDLFHLFGVLDGCRPAMTYSGMSAKYFQSMTLVNSGGWGSYDASDARRWKKIGVHQIVGEHSPTRSMDEDSHAWMTGAGVRSTLTVVPGASAVIQSLTGPELLARVTAAHRAGT